MEHECGLIPWALGDCQLGVDNIRPPWFQPPYFKILAMGLCQPHLHPQEVPQRALPTGRSSIYIPIVDEYAHLIPLAFETFGPINSKGIVFLNQLGHRLAVSTGDTRETSFLFQWLSLTIQRFNAICFNGSFALNNADNDS